MGKRWWGSGPPKKKARTPRAPRKRKCCQTPCPVHDAPRPWWAGLHLALARAASLGFTLEGREDSPAVWDEACRWADGPGVTLQDIAEAAARSSTPTRARDALVHLRRRWSRVD